MIFRSTRLLPKIYTKYPEANKAVNSLIEEVPPNENYDNSATDMTSKNSELP